MKVKDLTVEQLKTLIEETIDERLREYIGDPDEGLELKEEIIERLKANKADRTPRTSLEDVAKKYGVTLK
jgi:hypothetical protein